MASKSKVDTKRQAYLNVFYALLLSNGFSVVLFLFRVVAADNFRYAFLLWNLLLGWLPLLFAWLLIRRLPRSRWLSMENVLLTALWVGFLPNSFYLVSDLIHLHSTGEVSLLYDAVLFFSCIFNGYVAGFASIYLIHHELLKRLERTMAHMIIGVVMLLCSFAIYLGRNLRWNSWDVLVNPFGILFDVTDRLLDPFAHPQVIITTFTFFGLLGTMYVVMWQFLAALNESRRPTRGKK